MATNVWPRQSQEPEGLSSSPAQVSGVQIPRPSTGSWVSRAAGTWTTFCRWQLYSLCDKAGSMLGIFEKLYKYPGEKIIAVGKRVRSNSQQTCFLISATIREENSCFQQNLDWSLLRDWKTLTRGMWNGISKRIEAVFHFILFSSSL